MLESLRSVVQEVSGASGLDEGLAIMVRRVRESMRVDACSIYMYEKGSGDLVLMATDGLNPDSVGTVRLRPGEGLVGLVAERQEPVNLDNAAAHPRYRYFPEKGEEDFPAFLGVPIIHYREVLGALVAQQRGQRQFSQEEVDFLFTVAAQFAGAIHHAAATGNIIRLLSGQASRTQFIRGIAGAPGIAIGTIAVSYAPASLESIPDRPADDIAAEKAALRRAVHDAQKEMRATRSRLGPALPREARRLFDVYGLLLGSSQLTSETVQRIRAGRWAPAALRDTIAEHARYFDQMEDPYLRARGEDIREIGRRILGQLLPADDAPRSYPERCVLVGDELGISQFGEVPLAQLAGIVSTRGSALSHTAVLAGALGVPAVMGVADLPLERLEGREVVVDGYQGRIYIQPSPVVLAEYRRLAREEEELLDGLRELRDLPAETRDGKRVSLRVNAGLMAELGPGLDSGAEGVGLYRTEFPFLVRESFPGENEQYDIYQEVLRSWSPRPVTLRTLDVGGDKSLPYFSLNEDNPFLGSRGIRLTLDHPEIFLTQLRAMLRANAALGNLRILLPFITTVSELDEALGLLRRAHEELNDEGQPCAMAPVGAMIEVPAAVYVASALAQRVDFLAIGTNDLTQYMLAVDRNNARVATLYDNLHPAVIRASRSAVEEGHGQGKSVAICGEMAGDPAAALLLLGMGIDQLSMAASSIPRVKSVIRTFSYDRARELLGQALTLDDPRPIRKLVNAAIDEAGLGGLVRPGK